jgi:hypothetical protein
MKPLLETARPYIPLRVRIEEGWIDSCFGGSIKSKRPVQTIIQVICSRGKSLRDSIVNDPRLPSAGFSVHGKLKPGRPRGWAKIHSVLSDRRGALNIEWDPDTNILLCRVINKRAGRPDKVLGDFVAYLFDRHRRRIRVLNIISST